MRRRHESRRAEGWTDRVEGERVPMCCLSNGLSQRREGGSCGWWIVLVILNVLLDTSQDEKIKHHSYRGSRTNDANMHDEKLGEFFH